MKILLGGIPLGCDNIGDEAIIAGVVKMLKESLPGVELTVATADPATAELLGVGVVPPFGFAGHGLDGFEGVVRRQDAYIWCGATGLSDYPHVALDLLEVLRCLGLLGWYERRLRDRLAHRIAAILPRCRGVWLRDPQSAAMLARTGFADAGIAADTAILLGNGENPTQRRGDAERSTLGLCISTQRQVADLDGLKGLIAAVRESGARVIGIPMNPKTDRALLESLGVECITGTTPEAVMEAAAKCSVVLSSRLHLLILAANAGTPGLGIARGSKLANWLSNFGRTVEGSVYDCDWDKVTAHVLAALKDCGEWDAVRSRAYAGLMSRLEKSRRELVSLLRG